jgi:spermidine/putrescine transport system substrate-binding protein
MDRLGATDGDRLALHGRRLTRGQFLTGMGVGAAALVVGSKASSVAAAATTQTVKGGTLNIYSWPAYFSTQNLSTYKKLTGTHINISTYQSNDAMFAKLAASNGNAGFDMAIPTSGWIKVMAAKGLLQKIDHSRVPFSNIDPQLLNKVYDPGNQYSVPKDYGYDGIVYDPAVIGKNITTWMDFIDAIKGPASGKSAYDIGYGTIATGLWALGYSMNTQKKSQLDAAGALMKSTAPHVKTFSGFDITGCVSGEIALMSCDQSVARQVLMQNKKMKFVVPGPHSELWVDNYTILKGASDANQAYSFLDFQLKPANQITDTKFIGYPTALKGLQSVIPASTPLRNMIFIPPKVYNTLETFVVNTGTIGYIENLANQVQAA